MTNLYRKLRYYLIEMSLDKKSLEKDIRDKTEKINEHLLKCLLIQNTTNTLNHWSQEVYNFLHSVPKLKGSNKLPNERILHNCTLGYFGDVLLERLDYYVEELNDLEHTNITDYNKQSLYDCILDYYKWLIPMLSTQGTIKNSQVKSQINTLIQKYNKENTKPKVGAV